MNKRYFSVGGQVLVVQSTHDNVSIPGATEVDEVAHSGFLAAQDKLRVDAEAADQSIIDKLRAGKQTEAQKVYDEAVKLSFSPTAAGILARGVYAGWTDPSTGTTTTTTTTSGTAAPLSFANILGATSKAAGSIIKTANTLAWDAGGWGDKTGTILLWQANTLGATAMLGWSPAANPDWKTVAHGLYIAGGNLSVYENGVEKAKTTLALSDLVTITIVGTSVIYAKNSTLLFTSSKQAGDFLPAVLLRSYNVELTNIKFM